MPEQVEEEQGESLQPKNKLAQAEKKFNEACSLCEKIFLRALVFGCFLYEGGRFILSMLR